jgi:hypothetical protein
MRPVLRFSYGRDAYVLRFVGDQYGPVLRRNRRRRRGRDDYSGRERRDMRGQLRFAGHPYR